MGIHSGKTVVRDWKGKRVVIIGLARQGKALAQFLSEKGAEVVVSDQKSAEQLGPAIEELAAYELTYQLGGHPNSLLEGTDVLFLSGGVPIDLPIAIEARERGIELANDTQLFLEACCAPVIGITGSAGKTTTTSLVGRMAEIAFKGSERRVWVGGNIGRPLLNDLDEIKSNDLVIMELSSFQLELMTLSPHIAAVLNLTPDHLDRHGSMDVYAAAKKRILANQSEEDIAVVRHDDPLTWEMRSLVQGKLIAFDWEQPTEEEESAFVRDGILRLKSGDVEHEICSVEEVSLRGKHNLMNLLAASALASAAGLPIEAMTETARNFQGIPHRLEFVRRVRGVEWYNDSIATTPDRALAAVRAFEEPKVLLAGGQDKDLPWETFAHEVVRRVDHLILFGEAAQKIERHIQEAAEDGVKPTMVICESLADAVQEAAEVAEEGDVVVLSPGGTSFDEFSNYEVRGERFRVLVEEL
ncbi:MAG: UDP-N-acetylmuramoyl-L-alanine--D-glutamate ligase [Anaerolineales bacterium]|nr:MAG: UDP-N-acetylmuramoyl-L-alanine--D-glutamate ligase [Anaerolineales bacterium]